MNILFLNNFNARWKIRYNELRAEFPDVKFTAGIEPEDRGYAITKADCIIAGRLNTDEINSAKNLMAVIVPYTGLNNFPVELTKQRDIKIYNTHANAPYVAEKTVALTLALLGKVVHYHNNLKLGNWNRSNDNDEMWITLHNKRICILGYGFIGSEIAKLLKPFNVYITGFRRNVKNGFDEYANLITNEFNKAIADSEIIFNTLPLSNETKDIINAENIINFKDKYIITVGRGETIREEVLYNALKNNVIKGAAIDVWYNYPGKSIEPVFPAKFPFWELPNVVLSPHKSSQTIEAVNAMIDDTCNNIRLFIKSNSFK